MQKLFLAIFIASTFLSGCGINDSAENIPEDGYEENPHDQDAMPDVYDNTPADTAPSQTYPEDPTDQNILPEEHEP